MQVRTNEELTIELEHRIIEVEDLKDQVNGLQELVEAWMAMDGVLVKDVIDYQSKFL